MNALLDPFAPPAFAALTPEAIGPALDAALGALDNAVTQVIARKPKRFEALWLPIERARNELEALWSSVGHLKSVADTPEIRAAYAEGQEKVVETLTAIMQNNDLYRLLADFEERPEFAALPLADRVAVEHELRDFRLSGVALEGPARARFAEIAIELSRLATEFSTAVVDATDAWVEPITDPARLAGLPEAARAMFAAAAQARGLEGWAVTLQMPSVSAVLTFAEDRALRQAVYTASGTRASDQGPQAGRFDNGPRIARILALRREAAALLGFSDPVALSLATKMAPDAGEVLHFLRDLAKRARPSAERDLAELRAFASETLGLDDLQPWDVSFASNRLRQARHAIDEEELRGYFPIARVLEGWQSLLHRLFGISLRPRDDIEVWHEDVRYYDVTGEDGAVIAGLYCDLHARPGKKGGAWMDQARPRLRDGNNARVPVAYCVCNFAPPTPDMPALLSHDDVQTLLHETGHCLHLLFTKVDRPSIAGTNGFEWDAVELPSQLMEDFAWDQGVLTAMSGHWRTGAPLPPALFERMLAARQFQSGLFILRQVEFGLFDLLLHLGTLGSDPMEVIEAVRDEVSVLRPPAWHRFPHAFSHIFAGGYASGYYSYLWAEVLSADGFGKFAEAGLIDRATGDAFREEVLARGATRPAAESFRAFRGRDPDPTGILLRNGLLAG